MWSVIAGLFGIAAVAAYFLRERRRPACVSIVLLRSDTVPPTREQLSSAYQRAYSLQPRIDPLNSEADSASFLLSSPDRPRISVSSCARPYIDPEQVSRVTTSNTSDIAHDGLLRHRSWLSIDACGVSPDLKASELALVHAYIGKIAAELVDDQTTLLYLPASELVAPASSENTALLRHEKTLEVFHIDARPLSLWRGR